MLYLDRPKTLSWSLLLLPIIVLFFQQWHIAKTLGTETSAIASPFTEDAVLRSAHHYYEKGLTADLGIPNVTYGAERPRSIRPLSDAHLPPPGSNWICGVMMKLFGVNNVPILRLIPIALGIFSLGFLAWVLVQTFGPYRGAVLFLLNLIPPMAYNMMHGLHFQGYANSLLRLQIALLILALSRRAKDLGRFAWLLGLVGFLQGWLSFEYTFVVIFAVVPFVLLERRNINSTWKTACRYAAPSIIGLGLAHSLHFLQVVGYLGSISAAVHDYYVTFIYRTTGFAMEQWTTVPPIAPKAALGTWAVVKEYLIKAAPSRIHFNFPILPIFLLLSLGLLKPWSFRIDKYEIVWDAEIHAFAAVIASFVISLLWIVIMRHHAWEHQNFVPRLLYLWYFVTALATVNGFQIKSLRKAVKKPASRNV